MKYKNLSFFQIFNAMRQYLTSYLDIQENGDISVLLSALKLDTSRDDWRVKLWTWDEAIFDDWMRGVNKVLKDFGIDDSPQSVKYNEEMAFLCMKSFLNFFYDEVSYQDIAMVLKKINLANNKNQSSEWRHWLSCIEYAVINEPNICG